MVWVGFAAKEVSVYALCMLATSLGKILDARAVGETHYLSTLHV